MVKSTVKLTHNREGQNETCSKLFFNKSRQNRMMKGLPSLYAMRMVLEGLVQRRIYPPADQEGCIQIE
jgi:hypothetical protein